MDPHIYAIIELVLVFGAVLGFGLWELYSLRRDKKRSQQAQALDAPGPASGDRGV